MFDQKNKIYVYYTLVLNNKSIFKQIKLFKLNTDL